MINTFFGSDTLGGGAAFLASLLIGFGFGFVLEQAGFGSSRKLAGIFYLRDMTVLKVMFTGLITAMLGLYLAMGLGVITADQVYLLPTVYGAQIVGGLLFGIGFAMAAWCPGTAAVGLASGRLDALLFLVGTIGGSILFNETYTRIEPLYTWGDSGVQFVWQSLGVAPTVFALFFTAVAVGAFWLAERTEKAVGGPGTYWNSPFLKAFSMVLLVVAVSLAMLPPVSADGAPPTAQPVQLASAAPVDTQMLTAMEAGLDHVEPEDLADRLLAGDASLLLVDIRTPSEYQAFHIPGASNVAAADLPARLAETQGKSVVLYSNGMTHPAQTRDALARAGFSSIYILTDGLEGFLNRVLKPVSLRGEPLTAEQSARVQAWRRFLLGSPALAATATQPASPAQPDRYLVDTAWLAERIGRRDVRTIDLRSQPAYNGGHIPGSVCMSPEHFRGVVRGVSSSLLPAAMIAQHLGLLGINPQDTVVIVPTDKLQDATLVAIALERVGHQRYAILDGGFEKWAAEKRPLTTMLPDVQATTYTPAPKADAFTLDYQAVLPHVTGKTAVLIDSRPADAYSGKKVEEARGGHIPGAKSRPFSQDIAAEAGVTRFKPISDLEAAYAGLIPSKDSRVIVYCRTGHQASQAFFVLKRLLGYRNVLWYDGSWSEWASRPELPAGNPSATAAQ